MNELNPLVLALNDIDTHYIVEPERKKRHIAPMIAVAAAAVTLLTGYTVHTLKTGTRGVNIDDEHQFYHDITLQNSLTIPTKD